jgi:hypothetical protein
MLVATARLLAGFPRPAGPIQFPQGHIAMTTRLLALAALLSLAAHGTIASGQQTTDGQCNCPKCQAARQAAADNETMASQPAGMFSAEATGIFAPGFGTFFAPQKKTSEVQQAGHHHHAHAAPGYCPPGAGGGFAGGYAGPDAPYIRHPGPGHGSHGMTRPEVAAYGLGTFPNGSCYDHGHPGRPFDGGRYGYFGGAHRTPGYPHHHQHREYVGPQGPPTAQVAYPYYTTRGPRDFLLDNPPSIGR